MKVEAPNSRIVVALAQVASEREPERNLDKARDFIQTARARGAQMVIFPEYFMSWGRGRHDRASMSDISQPLSGGFVTGLSELAKQHEIWLVAGMIESPSTEGDGPFNTSVAIAPDGLIATVYRKTHLFDAFDHHESEIFSSGSEPASLFKTPLGPAGLFVCYELRFPEVARSLTLAGAEILIVPSAWVNGPLKEMQWETLLRTRAIENCCYVLAPAQTGNEYTGRSMIVDPLGVVAASAGYEETLVVAEIDRKRIEAARNAVHPLTNRRPELYDLSRG